MPALLSQDERAYRRGCLQLLQFLTRDLIANGPVHHSILCRLGFWEQALIEGRDSWDVDLLGKYLDEIQDRVDKADKATRK